MKVLTLWLSALLLTMGAADVAAQSPEDDSGTPAVFHLGPLQLTPAILLQDMGIDTNVYNTREFKQSDFTFALTPRVDGLLRSRRTVLTFQSLTDFVYFAKQDSERGVNQQLLGTGVVNLGRAAFMVRGTYWNTRRRPNEEIDARARRVETSADAGVRIGVFGKAAVEAGARWSSARYDPDAFFNATLLAETLNRDVTIRYGGVRYSLTPLTAMSVTAELAEERFVRAPIRDADWKAVTAAIEFSPRALVFGSARFGYQRFVPLSPALPSFEGVIGGVDIGYRLSESTQLGATYDRRPSYSYEELEPYYLGEGVGGWVRRELTAAVVLDVRARQNWYNYRPLGSGAERPNVPARIDTWTNASAAVEYQVNRNVMSTFQVSHWRRGSDVNDYHGLDGFRIGTSMAFRF